jgi:uncharacterized Tic20 family protein
MRSSSARPAAARSGRTPLIHLSTFAGFLGIPFANIIAPLVIWLIKTDKSLFVDFHGKEAINFQISLLIYSFAIVVGFILAIVLISIVMLFVLIPALFIFWIVPVVVAAIKASQGEWWEYPLSIRFLK